MLQVLRTRLHGVFMRQTRRLVDVWVSAQIATIVDAENIVTVKFVESSYLEQADID